MELNNNIDLGGLRDKLSTVADRPLIFIAAGAIVMALAGWLLFGGSNNLRDSQLAMEQGQTLVASVGDPVRQLRETLRSDPVQARALAALSDPSAKDELLSLLQGRLPSVHAVDVYPPDLVTVDTAKLGEQGLVKLDMLLNLDPGGSARVQLLREDGQEWVAGGAAIGDVDAPDGYVLVLVDQAFLLEAFNVGLPAAGYVGLDQLVSGFAPRKLREVGAVPAGLAVVSLPVPGSLFRVLVPQAVTVEVTSGFQRLMLFLLGTLLLAYGLIRRQLALRSGVKFKPDPDSLVVAPSNADDPADWSMDQGTYIGSHEAETPDGDAAEAALPSPDDDPASETPPEPPPTPVPVPDYPQSRAVIADPVLEYSSAEIPLTDSYHELVERQKQRQLGGDPVELSQEIFRAYDIRGVVGQTLDAGVAFQVGQAVGSLALERAAAPVVVARDGRHSGPALVQGLVEGLQSTGCDVIDIGAVPTGTLYYAAYELGAGSGVMVTGSHNPPDYNGLKILVGGHTLSGDMITGLYDRIVAGELRTGAGSVRQENVLARYQQRIADDIQLARPLKVVADCGNGIGGACAIEILRAIGAEVLPLFDDVDGDFPNHHPDPSDPHNLEDLVNAVELMGADLGVAFDGDADRLGVVTPRGDIVFADRLMMLYAKEILGRHPGETIIYDVKCTGHLDRVIAEAGGRPEMYKTGHSLIKNYMKEVGSPFAGEMSGHFFFKDRWYGFDCGIYAAARLLEILAADERSPQDVLDSLPNSVSTPELKVELEEGENHAFIKRFQAEAEFEGARVNTIDGLRADFSFGWGLVRASNTTPILVLRFDADTEADLERVQEAFRQQLLAIKPDLQLPF